MGCDEFSSSRGRTGARTRAATELQRLNSANMAKPEHRHIQQRLFSAFHRPNNSWKAVWQPRQLQQLLGLWGLGERDEILG